MVRGRLAPYGDGSWVWWPLLACRVLPAGACEKRSQRSVCGGAAACSRARGAIASRVNRPTTAIRRCRCPHRCPRCPAGAGDHREAHPQEPLQGADRGSRLQRTSRRWEFSALPNGRRAGTGWLLENLGCICKSTGTAGARPNFRCSPRSLGSASSRSPGCPAVFITLCCHVFIFSL